MNYKDLQTKAKELGLKYVGVSRKNLEESIRETGETKKTETTTQSPIIETPKESPEKVNEKLNAAIVRDNFRNEIRRYNVEVHGKNFAELAMEFAKSKGRKYNVELIEVKPGIKCPDCGNIIYI